MIEEWRVSQAGVVAHLTAVVGKPGGGEVRISACGSDQRGSGRIVKGSWRIVNGMPKCAKCLDYQKGADA